MGILQPRTRTENHYKKICEISATSVSTNADALERTLYELLDPYNDSIEYNPIPAKFFAPLSSPQVKMTDFLIQPVEAFTGICNYVANVSQLGGWKLGNEKDSMGARLCAQEVELHNIYQNTIAKIRNSSATFEYEDPAAVCGLASTGRSGAVVFIELTGTAGMGKSKLLAQFMKDFDEARIWRKELCDLSRGGQLGESNEASREKHITKIRRILSSQKPLLFLLDEASANQQAIAEFLATHRESLKNRNAPIVIVLASRMPVLDSLEAPIDLPVLKLRFMLHHDGSQRVETALRTVFKNALHKFMRAQQNIDEIDALNWATQLWGKLDDTIRRSPRALVLAAWLVVRDGDIDKESGYDKLLSELAKTEEERWMRLGASSASDLAAARDLIALDTLGVFDGINQEQAAHLIEKAGEKLDWSGSNWAYQKALQVLGIGREKRALPPFLAELFAALALQHKGPKLVSVALSVRYELPGGGRPTEQASLLLAAYELFRRRIDWLLERWPEAVEYSADELMARGFEEFTREVREEIECEGWSGGELEALCAFIRARSAVDEEKKAYYYEKASTLLGESGRYWLR